MITEQTIVPTNLDDLAIGTAEPTAGKKLEPKDVVVAEIVVKQVKGVAGKPDWESLLISVQHPDKAELISIGKAKVEKDGNLKVVSLSLDKDNTGAASARFRRYLLRMLAPQPHSVKQLHELWLCATRFYLCLFLLV